MMGASLGIFGLDFDGANLARNAKAKGLDIALREHDGGERFAALERDPSLAGSLYPDDAAFIAALDRPRRIFLVLPSVDQVDGVIARLLPGLARGDCLVDVGNSWYRDTERRAGQLCEAGICFVGVGLSGGAEGGLNGPSFMAGGDEGGRRLIEPLLDSLAAKGAEGQVCSIWTGPRGSGHFVKMVHNALEYADMEMLAEAYHLLKASLRASPDEMRTCFSRWDRTEISSHLLGLVVDILGVREGDGVPLLDRVLDRATQKGSGIHAIECALELGSQASTLAEAVFARNLSALKDERVAASVLLGEHVSRPSGNPSGLMEDVRRSILAAKIVSYAEGFALLTRASAAQGWNLDPEAVARAWRAGAMIRCPFLDRVAEAYSQDPGLLSLLHDARMKILLDESLPSLRRVVARSVESGLPLPLFASAVISFDGQRSSWLPANLVQALRDRFGGHGFERIDRPRGEIHHADWFGEKKGTKGHRSAGKPG